MITTLVLASSKRICSTCGFYAYTRPNYPAHRCALNRGEPAPFVYPDTWALFVDTQRWIQETRRPRL